MNVDAIRAKLEADDLELPLAAIDEAEKLINDDRCRSLLFVDFAASSAPNEFAKRMAVKRISKEDPAVLDAILAHISDGRISSSLLGMLLRIKPPFLAIDVALRKSLAIADCKVCEDAIEVARAYRRDSNLIPFLADLTSSQDEILAVNAALAKLTIDKADLLGRTRALAALDSDTMFVKRQSLYCLLKSKVPVSSEEAEKVEKIATLYPELLCLSMDLLNKNCSNRHSLFRLIDAFLNDGHEDVRMTIGTCLKSRKGYVNYFSLIYLKAYFSKYREIWSAAYLAMQSKRLQLLANPEFLKTLDGYKNSRKKDLLVEMLNKDNNRPVTSDAD